MSIPGPGLYIEKVLDILIDESKVRDGALLRFYALLVMTKGTETTLENVHDAWSLWRVATRPDHRSLIPFDQLTTDIQELDRFYMDAIHRTAERLDREA